VKQKSNLKFLIRLGIVMAGVTLIAGCQSVSPGWRDSVRATIDDSLDEASGKRDQGVPSEVSEALLPPIEISLPDGKTAPLEPRFDLSVSRAPARQVFMGLVEGSKYSMVVHPDIKGVISLSLKEVTVPEAVKAIREVYGYEFRRDGDRFFILGKKIQTRLFTINYLNFIREGKSDTRVTSGGIGKVTSTGSGGAAAVSKEESGFSSILLETKSKSDFWKDLSDTLTAIVGTKGGRKVVVNPQTGIVVVRAMPSELRVVEEYIGVTHATINRQVLLEAKILEVELNDGFQAGINWSQISGDFIFGQVGGGTIFSGSGISEIAGNTGDLNPATGTNISGTNSSAFGGVFTIAAQSNDFAAFVELLKSQGEVQVLSSPRVSTVNNQKAVIKIGGDEFFVTGVTSSSALLTTGGTPIQTVPNVVLTSFFSGIVLDVTPQIDESDNIILHIHPSVSTVVQQNKSFDISGQNFTLPLALSTIQESDSIVRTKSRQIIVIGGLMKEASTDQNASVPLLGDIPVIGKLFRHKKVTRIKKELVILLKATVINMGQDWGDVVADSQNRIKKIAIGTQE